MGNLVDNLKKYFESNSDEQIFKDWNSVEQHDEVGPTVSEFLTNITDFQMKILDPDECFTNFINENLNPNFTSGFFIPNKFQCHGKSSLFFSKISI
jgi:hypothetical protein